MPVDYVYRLETPHVVGSLARTCETIAQGKGLVGDIVTVNLGRDRSIREISIEVTDHGQAKRLAGLLESLDGVHVLDYYDRALRRHDGGKLAIDGIIELS